MQIKYLRPTLIATICLMILEGLIGALTDGPSTLNFYLWSLLSKFLISIVIGYYIVHSRLRSSKLWLATFTILYVIGNFNINIEALIFNVTDQAQNAILMLGGIPISLLEAILLTYLFGKHKMVAPLAASFAHRKVHHWIAKILAGNFLYFAFYVIAGMLLSFLTPRFNDFYGDKIPTFITIILTNMFFRGFLFVAITILIYRTTNGSKWSKAILIGSIFAIVGGIAPLIPPSDYMPEFIRRAHGFEVGISNFLYGLCTFLIVRSKPAA